jgi:hypothetical protein
MQEVMLPLKIIGHNGFQHDLTENGHNIKLSDDLCTQM